MHPKFQSWFNQKCEGSIGEEGLVDLALRLQKPIPKSLKPRNIQRERIKVERTKPFVTFYGDPNNMPLLTSSGNAKQYGTVNSAT
ncbi:hypothetical protein Leryth_024046 [Lithospermum erythrorhizon]|nr:hypothetical protein Leryth_024046 [Lithospermum erythrorhizon]